MFVKICGITTLDDARHALSVGADALGFVLSVSVRQVDPERVAEVVRSLPPAAMTVGVFRHERPDVIERVAALTGVSAVQVHPASPEDAREVRSRVPFLIEAFPATDRDAMARARASEADLVLLDGPHPGSGRTFDWTLLEGLGSVRSVVVAGGLTPDNVAEAVARTRPYGVDVSTGVEASPGRKDPEKVRRFVARARAAAGRAER
jgi:phosphoribosylanthranilate isomerase